ncbi:MAG: anti-sigma factor [Vicinamibacterales bacterium]
MFQEAPSFEQRLSDLQAQIDRLTIALQLWRDAQERVIPPDERLSRFADDVGDVLREWSAIGDRHARAVDALEQQVAAFADIESRLHRESADRFLTLQRMVEEEWTTLRQLQFEPGHRREQAAELTQACVAATHARVDGNRATPLAGAERELQQQLADVFALTPAASPEIVLQPEPIAQAPLPVRTHASSHGSMASEEVTSLRTEMTGRLQELRVLLRESEERASEGNQQRHRTHRRTIAALVTMLAIAVGAGVWWVVTLQRQVSTTVARLADVEARAERSAAESASALATARVETARLADAARTAAADTEAIGAVLSAPDLVRYGLTGIDGPSISAQLLWSRSRGIVMSATRLPSPPDGFAYHVWLLTGSDAVSAGILRVNDAGRGTLIVGTPPSVPRPVIGVSVTVEPREGSSTPTGRIVALNQLVRPAP